MKMIKGLFLIMFTLLLGMSVNAQKYYYEAADDTISADTNVYPSSAATVSSKVSTGVIGFSFTKVDVTDSLSFARLEGYDGVNWIALTGNAALVNTTTDGTTLLYASTPLIYLEYRARLACASGDVVAITNPITYYKKD